MKLTHDMLQRLDELEEKYAVMGQDMLSYLDGLLHADYLTYWDYIHLDTLLSLQTPRTPLPDESIFITYHQITELYFKLILQAMEQIINQKQPELSLFKRQLKRLNRYFDNLIYSFDIMVDGMDKEEFLKFRMSLLPASGFQSVQYRMIEIMSTDLWNLVHFEKRKELRRETTSLEELFPWLYWKSGAIELVTGKKTLTLQQFERKYGKLLLELAERMQEENLYQCYLKLPEEERQDEELIQLLKEYDFNTTVRWALSHFRSAARYMNKEPEAIKATGGTNWQKYLPPQYQRIIFFPLLWSEDEILNWGKSAKAVMG